MCPPTLAMVQNSGKKQLSCFHDKAATSVTCSFCLYTQHLIAGPTTTIEVPMLLATGIGYY
jgi:hypothetical protein